LRSLTHDSMAALTQRFRRRFGTIGWKLTGAYVLVSLLLALTLLAVLLGGVFYLLTSPVLPTAMAESAREYAEIAAAEYRDPNGDVERLIEQLGTLSSAQVSAQHGAAEARGRQASEFEIEPEDFILALLDPAGQVVVTSHPRVYPRGSAFAAYEPSPAAELIARARNGITETVQLGAWTAGSQPIAAAPVLDRDGTLLGVIYMRMVVLPPLALIFSQLLPIVLLFSIPWLILSGVLGMLYAWLVGRGFSRRLQSLTSASHALAEGDLGRRVTDGSIDEIGQLGREFNRMAEQLGANLRSLRRLADENAQLAERAGQFATVEERNRLARELHDSVSQELFSLTMLAAATRRIMEHDPQRAGAQLAEIEQMARHALEETRTLIFALRPVALDDRGLVPALRDLVVALEQRQGLKVDLQIRDERRLPLAVEQDLYRIVQEALANVARHSGERTATVALAFQPNGVELSISDQGQGFDPEAPRRPQAIGLQSMAERARNRGGWCTIQSEPGHGTRVKVHIPVEVLKA
jgi:two-component system, NarL family, sensor histidine kinase LiaS